MRMLAFLTMIFIIGCSTSKKTCITNIEIDNYEINNTVFKQARYNCADWYHTMKVMYDKYGKWNETMYAEDPPMLMWEKIDLLGSGKLYKVYAYGRENINDVYAGVMVFDQNDNDILALNTREKEQIVIFFKTLLSNMLSTRNFLDVYREVRYN